MFPLEQEGVDRRSGPAGDKLDLSGFYLLGAEQRKAMVVTSGARRCRGSEWSSRARRDGGGFNFFFFESVPSSAVGPTCAC